MSQQNNITNLRNVIKEEHKKCMLDPIYFMKKYIKIQHPVRGTLPFELYPFQEESLRNLICNDYNIILKSRQLGITTLTSAYALWLMIFHTDKNVLCISIKQETAKEIVTKVRFANDNLPSWLKVPCTEDNRLSLRLKNGSQIKAVSSSGDAGRSSAISLLIVDEAAFIDNIEKIWTSAQSTLSTGGKAIILSTPNGVGNFFHKTWVEAEEGKNKFKIMKLPWHLHPERDQTWRNNQTTALGPREAAQECFDGLTRIYTSRGLVSIKDVVVNDLVITHTGQFKKVKNIIHNKSSNYFKIHSSLNRKKSLCTSNHPFYTQDCKWEALNNINNNALLNSFPLNTDISIFEKSETIDLLNCIKPNHFKLKTCNDGKKIYINDRKHKTIHNRYINVDYDLGFLIGLYLAEGWCADSDNVVYFTFNWEKELLGWPQEIIKIIKNKFGIENYKIHKFEDNGGHLTFCSQILVKALKVLTNGDNCYDKHLSQFSWNVTNNLYLKGILDGCFLGDGMNLKEYNKSFSSRSENLTYDIKYICSILNLGLESYSIDTRTQYKNNSPCYIIRLLDSKNLPCEPISTLENKFNKNYKNHNIQGFSTDYEYSTLYKETADNCEIDTYNLEVEEDHSYITEHFIVHNCDCDFTTTGHTLVDAETLKYYRGLVKEPEEKRYVGQSLWIWDYAKSGRNYITCADVARGDGEDKSAFHIFDLESLEQVAEYDGFIDTKSYGKMLVDVSTEYNKAILVVENNNIGWATLQEVIDLNYPNTFYSSKDMTYVDVEKQLVGNLNRHDKNVVVGFTTSNKTRPLMLSKLESYFRDRSFGLRSQRTMNELSTFVWHNSKAEAMTGFHDDLVTSLAIGLWVRDTALRLKTESAEITRAMLNGVSRITNDKIYTPHSDLAQKSWKMPGRNGKTEDLKWLL